MLVAFTSEYTIRACVHQDSFRTMMRVLSVFLMVLSGLVVSILAQTCDPNAPYVVQPYDGETTSDPESLKRLSRYWDENKCFKLSDDSEPTPEIQCKKVCQGGAKVEKVSSTCNYGNSPWASYNTGKPLLCGTDKSFQGM